MSETPKKSAGEVAKQEGGCLEWTVGAYRRGSTGYE